MRTVLQNAATLSTLLFRMDQADTEGALAEATRAMAALLKQPEYQHLATSIGIWLKLVLLPPIAAVVSSGWSRSGRRTEALNKSH